MTVQIKTIKNMWLVPPLGTISFIKPFNSKDIVLEFVPLFRLLNVGGTLLLF